MEKTYRPWNPHQAYLLPPSPTEWLHEDHLAYFLLDVLSELDLSGIEARYQEKDRRGTRPYDPRMMTAVLLYGYCTGMPSSRRLERATYEDVPVRVLVGEHHPDHTRISEFRREHLSELSRLFVQVLGLCRRAGLVKLGHVAIDGTKVKANASKHKAMSYQWMEKREAELEAEVQRLLERAEQVDREEDAKYGKGRRGDELPEELRRREDRLKKIREAKAQLEAEAAAARARALAEQVKKAEPGAKGPKSNRAKGRAKLAKRKAREAREKARRTAKVAKNPPPDLSVRDRDELPSHRVPCDRHGDPKAKAQRNFTDPDSRIMKRDGAYLQGYNAQAVVDGSNQVIVAHGLTNQAPDQEHLRPMLNRVRENCGEFPRKLSGDSGYWSEENDSYCREHGVDAYIATEKLKHGESAPATRGRPPGDLDAKGRMRRKLRTKKGREIYARRKVIPEPVFGQMRQRHGVVGFLLRGVEKARGEWALMCIAHDLLKLRGARQAAV